jgi:hypothetical protein
MLKIDKVLIDKIDGYFARGLCSGVGKKTGQVCIEAALSLALGEGLNDKPTCVQAAVRRFSVALNDKNWSSPVARATGMRRLALAQLGSSGTVDGVAFVRRLTELTIREIVPGALRGSQNVTSEMLAAAVRCETEGTKAAAIAAAYAAAYDYSAYAAADYAAHAAAASADADADADADDSGAAYVAADYAAYAADADDYADTSVRDEKLSQSAELAVRVLIELGSPGAAWLEE